MAASVSIPTTPLPSGASMPVYGLGTWRMGESARVRAAEMKALRHGIDRGVTLIDTAEMYGDGEAESIVADAVGNRRDDMFIVSKVLPNNASRRGTVAACERSLKRLKTDRIDLYLLHWRGSYPLADTVAAFEELRAAGKIRGWGVSNLDHDDMHELWGVSHGRHCQTDQVLYNLTRRGIEFDLLPFCREHKMPVMAYSPLEQARMLGHRTLAEVAKRHGASAAQVALAWLLRQNVIVIPKATSTAHVDENLGALQLKLTTTDVATLDRAFPAPTEQQPLDML
jgi:diketogulonate reductase-like aldo/keto reductase